MSITPPPRKKNQGMAEGSGFNRLLNKRINSNNLGNAVYPLRTGKTKPRNPIADLSDKITSPRNLNTQVGNPRQGQEYSSGYTATGNVVHTYKYGDNVKRVVLAKKVKPSGTFKRY